MGTEPLERKVAAILYADVAGYSRLTGADEEGTHRALSTYLDTLTTSIERHNGKVLHYAGDAVLAEFASVVNALTCAVVIQRDLRARSEHLSEQRKVQFRIGINLGDVIVDRDEIYGDGVNVAARLENLAEPGGICISEAVHSAIGNKLPLDYESLGEQRVKNIAEPVRAYRVRLEDEAVPTAAPAGTRSRRRLVIASAALVVLGVLAGGVAWLKPWPPTIEPASDERTAVVLPDKPSIAVLPFANMSGDAEQEYFTDGMTDDLITDLSKVSGLFVIARNSVFTYKGKSVKISQVAEELGVRYVLEGSVRRVGDKVRINAQLIDGNTGGHVWAERYDGSLGDVFSLQDKVTRRIVAALRVQLTPQEQALATGRDKINVAAYDTFLKGWAYLLRKTPEDAVQAIAFFKQALELDPNYSRAYAGLAQTYWNNSLNAKFHQLTGGLGVGTLVDWNDLTAWEFLQKAGDKPLSQARALAARMLQRQRRFDEAMREARQAVALGPSDPTAYDALIENLIYAGEVEEAIRLVDRSIRLDPSFPGEKLFLKGLAYYTMGRLEEALSSIERARTHNPKRTRYAAIQAATLAELGRAEEAKAAFEEYRSGLTIFATLNWTMFYWPFEDVKSAERLAKGLLKAGMIDSTRHYYVVSPQNRLRSDQIKALLANKTMIGADRSPYGSEGEFEVTRDQNAQVVSQDFVTYFREGTTKTRVKNDLLCDPWQAFGDYCVAIYRNPDGTPEQKDEYIFFTLVGVFTFSVFDSAS